MYDFIPVLSGGSHDDPSQGACVMEMVSFMSGDKWTDFPECTDYGIAIVAQNVNDKLTDEDRHLIMSQFDRLFNTNTLHGEQLREFYDEVYAYFREVAIKHGLGNIKCSTEDMTSTTFLEMVEDRIELRMLESVLVWLSAGMAKAEATGEDYVAVLSGVLDIYDRITGRKSVVRQDISKLAELPCQV